MRHIVTEFTHLSSEIQDRQFEEALRIHYWWRGKQLCFSLINTTCKMHMKYIKNSEFEKILKDINLVNQLLTRMCTVC